MKYFIIILLAIIFAPLEYLLYGWVISKLWLWYIVPQFDLRPLTIPNAIGLGILLSLLTYRYYDAKSEEDDPIKRIFIAIFATFSRAMIALLAGWVVLKFT